MIKYLLLMSSELEEPHFEFDSESILDSIMMDLADCIAIKDRQGRYVWINQAGARFLNRTIEDVIGKTDFELFERAAASKITQSDQEVMRSGTSKTVVDYLKPHDAGGRQFRAIKRAYRNRDGQVQGIINIVSEITSQMAHCE